MPHYPQGLSESIISLTSDPYVSHRIPYDKPLQHCSTRFDGFPLLPIIFAIQVQYYRTEWGSEDGLKRKANLSSVLQNMDYSCSLHAVHVV